MPSYGKRCEGCGGEDCFACEVYLESVADARASEEYDPMDDIDPETDTDFDSEDREDDEMDGDAATALASAGFGVDEDYEHETPFGDSLDSLGSEDDF